MSTTGRQSNKHHSGTDRECIEAIPDRAVVLGIDADDRAHLYSLRSPTEIWVLDATAEQCVHHVRTERTLTAWVEFVAEQCGWDVRHRVELPAGAGLLDDEDLPPTRNEVLGE